MRRVVIALGLLLSGGVARAADWWVAPGGSDGAQGGPTTPLLTIGAAVAHARAGDTVHVRAGTYLGGKITGQGSSAAPIVIRSEDGPRMAVLQGSAEPLFLSNAAFLELDGFEVRNSGDHAVLVDQSHDVRLSGLFVHDAGLGGSAIEISRSDNITVDGVEAARPGATASGLPPSAPCVELVQTTNSTVIRSFIHDGGGVLLSAHGGSQNIVFDSNVIAHQRDDGDAPPAVALGDASDVALLGGAAFEVTNIVLRNTIVLDAAHGAVGIADASGAFLANNLFLDVAHAGVELRAGSGAMHTSSGVSLANNLFVDSRGKLPQPFLKSGDSIGTFSAAADVYWNSGNAIPPSSGGVPVPMPEPGALTADPQVAAAQLFTSFDAAVAALKPGATGAAATPGFDTTVDPFGVVRDIVGVDRGGELDRGPYFLGELPDGGADDLAMGGNHGAGGGGGGGVLPANDSGCSCRVGDRASSPALGALIAIAIGLALLVLGRRRV